MMTVKLQVTTPNVNQVFMSFQTKLKSMDLELNYSGESNHLGFDNEPVKSTLKMEQGKLIHLTTGMSYGDKLREYEHLKPKEGNEELVITEKLLASGIIGKRFFERE